MATLEVRDQINSNIASGASTPHDLGESILATARDHRYRVTARGGAVQLTGPSVIRPNIYNTVSSEWFTKANNLLDRRGGNNLTQAETLVYTLETFGTRQFYSATFDGSNDWTKVDDVLLSPDPCPSGISFYWHEWFNTATIVNQVLMAKWNAGTAATHEVRLITLAAGTKLQFEYRGTNGIEYTVTPLALPATSTWVHVLAGVEYISPTSGFIHIYINGANGATTPVAAPLNQGTAPFTIGSHDNGNSKFAGKMTAPRCVVGVAPSAALAAKHFNSGVPLDNDNPFVLFETIAGGAEIAQDADDFVGLRCTPSMVQDYDCEIEFPHNGTGSPFVLPVKCGGVALAKRLEVALEDATAIENFGEIPIGSTKIGTPINHEPDITAKEDDVLINSVRLNHAVGAPEDYSTFPLVAVRDADAFVSLQQAAETGIVVIVAALASDEQFPNQSTGRNKCLANLLRLHSYNMEHFGVPLPALPPVRLRVGRYGIAGATLRSSELGISCYLYDGASTYGDQNSLDEWADYDESGSGNHDIMFGDSTKPVVLSTTNWIVMQVATDGSMMQYGFEQYINGYNGVDFNGNGVALYMDDDQVYVEIVVPTFSASGPNATYGWIDWQISWSDSAEHTATKHVFATGNIKHGVDVDVDRDSIGAGIYHVRHRIGPFDFRAEDVSAKCFQVWVKASTSGPGTPCGLTTMWPETAVEASRKGFHRIVCGQSGSDPRQMLTDYANGQSYLALLQPDAFELGGFGNLIQRNDGGPGIPPDIQTTKDDYDAFIVFMRTVVDGPVIIDAGWNLGPGGVALTTAQQAMLDIYASIFFAIPSGRIAVFNHRRWLEENGWDWANIPGTTLDGTHPGFTGGFEIVAGMDLCWRLLMQYSQSATIADSTTIQVDTTDNVTVDFAASIARQFRQYITPIVCEIDHDGIDSPLRLLVTASELAPIVQGGAISGKLSRSSRSARTLRGNRTGARMRRRGDDLLN